VNAKVVPAAHVAVHHELHLQERALAWLEGRRTDGRDGRSTPLDDFGIRRFRHAQRLVAHVRQDEGNLHRLAERNLAEVDDFTVDLQARLSADLDGNSPCALVAKKQQGRDQDEKESRQ
jgi:hypothetical protein